MGSSSTMSKGRMDTLRKRIGAAVKARAVWQLRQEHNGAVPRELLGKEIPKTWGMAFTGRPASDGTPLVRPGQQLQTLNEDQLRRLWSIFQKDEA